MIKVKAPKHWAYWHDGDGKYITDPEIRDGTEKCLQVRFITETDYRRLIKLTRAVEAYLEGWEPNDAQLDSTAKDLWKAVGAFQSTSSAVKSD